jgi:hypothetical protein
VNRVREWFREFVGWVTTLSPWAFGLGYPLGSLFLSIIPAGTFWWMMEAVEIAGWLPQPKGAWIAAYFMFWWVIVMLIAAWFLFGVGGQMLRFYQYDRCRALDELIAKADERIWLIGLSLVPFTEESRLRELKKAVVERNVEVRMLIVNPDSEVAKFRNPELYEGDETLEKHIHQAIEKFGALQKSINKNHGDKGKHFNLRKYRGNASMSTFLVDNEARVGIILNQETGLYAPELRVANMGTQISLFKSIVDHYESVYEQAEIIE